MTTLPQEQYEDRSALSDLIENGEPKALRLDNVSRLNSKVPNPMLFLTPMGTYGGNPALCLVALEGHYCEVMNLYALDRMRLWKIGLTFEAADALINEIGLAVQRSQRNA